ncbi:MAG: hypothetical protein ACYDA4_04185 [Ignavibacteriaceae bacterium]
MTTIELKDFLQDIGDSVHSMNTIAVALSVMSDNNSEIPVGLDISWKPKNLDLSKTISRNYAERSALVYAAESLFQFLESISTNIFWKYPDINFKGDEKKAYKVYNFLTSIPTISKEMAILAELLCHWRNKVVHAKTSNASLSSNKKDLLILNKNDIYETFHHFDISIALDNYNNNRITLKDVSTLITILIKCARQVDEYYFAGIAELIDLETYLNFFLMDSEFQLIFKQEHSAKKDRQLNTWLSMHYPYISVHQRNIIQENIIKKSRT